MPYVPVAKVVLQAAAPAAAQATAQGAAQQGAAQQGAAQQGAAQQLPGAPPPIPPLPAAPGAATGGQPGPTITVGGDAFRDAIRDQVRDAVAGTGQPSNRNEIPREVIPLAGITFGMFAMVIIFFPIARAIGRMIDRRTDRSLVRVGEVGPQLRALQESVDAMAIELERISEAQRFTAKLMAEKTPGALPRG